MIERVTNSRGKRADRPEHYRRRLRAGRLALAFLAAIGAAALPADTAGAQQPPGAAGTVRVYSYREPGFTQGLFATFQWTTGIKVELVHETKGLIERMKSEMDKGGADLLLTNDAALLVAARSAGVTEPLKSPLIERAVPTALRDPDGYWFGLSQNPRVLIVSRERIKDEALSYEELADPKWKGRICMRSGSHPYNVALFASILAHHGPARAEIWLKGIKANLARKPEGGDRDQIRLVHEGVCDIAIANSYYLGAMMSRQAPSEQQAIGKSVRIIFPNRSDRGSHVNISGMALAVKAPNRDNAVRLMEFLASAMAQKIYVNRNNEYPINTLVEPSAQLREWGILQSDPRPLIDIVRQHKAASELIRRIDFDALTQ